MNKIFYVVHIIGHAYSKSTQQKFKLANPNSLFLESMNFDKTNIEIIYV